MQTKSGGNAGNQLTAAAKLGIAAALVTKIGDDGIGDQMLQELHEVGVSTEHVLQAQGHSSPFTYIIVDREGRSSALAVDGSACTCGWGMQASCIMRA